MKLELTEEQSLLQGSLDKLLRRRPWVPAERPRYVLDGTELRQDLADGGFLEIATTEGYGTLDAAMLVAAAAQSPCAAEVAASALVAPVLDRALLGPLALSGGVGKPTRYLPQARHVIIADGERLLFADLDLEEAAPLQSVLAYPVGVLRELPSRYVALEPGQAEAVALRWRIALAAEAAGLMRAALDQTVAHVKDRRQFGRPLGDFQAVQHRLAVDEQIVSASFLLAMRAADSLRADDAALAALYAQEHMRKIVYDCHQFTGAMGVTLEHPLHLWTYRLKFIQGELGGRAAQGETLAELAF